MELDKEFVETIKISDPMPINFTKIGE